MDGNEIRFSDKKVDESWKESVQSEKDKLSHQDSVSKPGKTPSKPKVSNPIFVQFISSLAIQALTFLGEIENPATKERAQDLDAAKEMIDILAMLKEKTSDNLSEEEKKLMETAVSDLQLKYVNALNA